MHYQIDIVNSEFFTRVLFRCEVARKLNHFAIFWCRYIMQIFNIANMSSSAINEKKIIAKISEFTVYQRRWHLYKDLWHFDMVSAYSSDASQNFPMHNISLVSF